MKNNKKFYLSTHFIVSVGKKGVGKFIGKVQLAKPHIIKGYNTAPFDNIPIVGTEFIGTPEEIIKQVKTQCAYVLAQAELNQKPKSGKTEDINYLPMFYKRVKELSKI